MNQASAPSLPFAELTAADLSDPVRCTEVMLAAGDLDPSYTALSGGTLDDADLGWFLLSFLAFYNFGLSCQIVDSLAGWDGIYDGLKGKRGGYRRHFRADKALVALASWKERWEDGEAFVNDLRRFSGRPYRDVYAWSKTLGQVGDYFAWKLGDWVEVVGGTPVDFSGCLTLCNSEPKEGLLRIGPDFEKTADWLMTCVDGEVIPYGRPVLTQEVETMGCIFNSIAKKGVVPGEDTAHYYHDCLQNPGSTSRRLLRRLLDKSPLSEASIQAISQVKGFK